MWNLNQLNLSNPFDFTFDVYFGNHYGADGMVFVLQNTNNTAPPSLGGGLGYSGFPNQSIGVEFDDFDNGVGVGDISADHIALDLNGNTTSAAAGPVPMLSNSASVADGSIHSVRFVWDPATQTMFVYFDGSLRLQYTFPGGLVNSIFSGNPNVYWGWTGATGGLYNEQRVCIHFNSEFNGGTNYSSCGPDTVHFQSLATSGLGNIVDYAWDFADGTPIVHAQNPIHTFSTTGLFNVELTITDQSLCTASQTHQVTIYPNPVITPSHTNVACFGTNTGNATATISSGTQPFTAVWSSVPSAVNPNGPLAFTNTGLGTGNYSVTVSDANSCSVSTSYTITQPASGLTASVTSTNVTCFGLNNGTAAITVNGGSAGYTYSGNPISAGVTNLANLAPGNYGGTVLDANGCSQTISFIITEPPVIVINETHTNIRCYGDSTGDIMLTVSGGVGSNYLYSWNPNISISNTATLLPAGAYNITVIDQTNCQKTKTVTLLQPAQALSVTVQSTDVTCNGFSNGAITLTTSGGTPGYTYNWSPNISNTGSASGLVSNTYDVTVEDANNCSSLHSILISQPSQPLAHAGASTNLTCFQSNDGTLAVNETGGTSPYTYVWNPTTVSGGSANSLAAGSYNTTITDLKGCIDTAMFYLSEPSLLTNTETQVDVLCNGNATGSISLVTNGGTPGYTYNWNPNSSSTNTAVSIAAGLYSITITDANGCSLTQSYTIHEPPPLVLTINETDVLCNGDTTGTITASAQAGTPSYNFSATVDGVSFINSPIGQFANILAGNYTIQVVDQHLCTQSAQVIVNEPPVLTAALLPTATTCFHYSDGRIDVTAGGGLPAYSYTFSGNSPSGIGSLTGLRAGTYSLTLTDANGCFVVDSAEVTEPDSVLIVVSPNPVDVKLGEELQLSTSSNQAGALVFDWTPKTGLSCYDCSSPIYNGVYSQPYLVVARNAAGCQGTNEFIVQVIPVYDLFIPNAFTPNGDGNNDYWQLYGNMKGLKQVEVAVFNRLGEKVFDSHDIDFRWNGEYKGSGSPSGVYTYYAKFVWMDNHSDANYKGSINIIR